MREWPLSRRDGRSHGQSQRYLPSTGFVSLLKRQVFLLKGMLASNLSEIRSIVPLGWGYFPHASRYFVPGYDHAVPLGQNRFSLSRL
jgi:hypothetical protein